MDNVQTYERPIKHSVAHDDDASDADLPPHHTRVFSHVFAESIFDRPTEICAPVTMNSTAKRLNLWKNKKLSQHDSLFEKPGGDIRTLMLQLKKGDIKKIKRNEIRCSSKKITQYIHMAIV